MKSYCVNFSPSVGGEYAFVSVLIYSLLNVDTVVVLFSLNVCSFYATQEYRAIGDFS